MAFFLLFLFPYWPLILPGTQPACCLCRGVLFSGLLVPSCQEPLIGRWEAVECVLGLAVPSQIKVETSFWLFSSVTCVSATKALLVDEREAQGQRRLLWSEWVCPCKILMQEPYPPCDDTWKWGHWEVIGFR